MAEERFVQFSYRCLGCLGLFEVRFKIPDRCPACEVKREGILDQAEHQAVTQLEDPAEPGWQAKHSKPAWVVKEVKGG